MKKVTGVIIAVIILCYPAAAYEAIALDEEAAETLTIAQASKDVNCPECGHENKADINYCIKCGAPLKEEAPGEKIYCNQCGTAYDKGSNFCTTCGYAFEGKKPALGAAPAPAVHRISIYFTGGLASFKDATLDSGERRARDEIGTSWAVGGGFTLPIWSKTGTVQLSLDLSTEASFSKIRKGFAEGFPSSDLKISLIPARETAILGVGFGPRKMVKPFCGFGAGVGILSWEFVWYELPFDKGTDFKPLFEIPFGCEFQLTPKFALGVKADYLIITGVIEMERESEPDPLLITTSVPDVFLFGGTARFCF